MGYWEAVARQPEEPSAGISRCTPLAVRRAGKMKRSVASLLVSPHAAVGGGIQRDEHDVDQRVGHKHHDHAVDAVDDELLGFFDVFLIAAGRHPFVAAN